MKTIFLSILCLLILSANTCRKEGDDCHYKIMITNNSNRAIIAAQRFINVDSECILDGPIILPHENYEQQSRTCWESKISNVTPYELYITDTADYNAPNEFYSCDSIEYKNTILKHYTLSLEDLRTSNFTIVYP